MYDTIQLESRIYTETVVPCGQIWVGLIQASLTLDSLPLDACEPLACCFAPGLMTPLHEYPCTVLPFNSMMRILEEHDTSLRHAPLLCLPPTLDHEEDNTSLHAPPLHSYAPHCLGFVCTILPSGINVCEIKHTEAPLTNSKQPTGNCHQQLSQA